MNFQLRLISSLLFDVDSPHYSPKVKSSTRLSKEKLNAWPPVAESWQVPAGRTQKPFNSLKHASVLQDGPLSPPERTAVERLYQPWSR